MEVEDVKVWKQIYLIIEDARKNIREKVEGLVKEVDRKHGRELSSLAKEVSVTLYLNIEEGDGNPMMIMPVLYVVCPRGLDPLEAERRNKLVTDRIGDWASDTRLTVKPLGFHPTQYKQKY